MTYKETLKFLYSKLPVYQKQGVEAYKKDINNIKHLCKYINNPQDKLKLIHIGGTNGKGSTAKILCNILQKQKLKVGLYTSPHYFDFRERIQINNNKIEKVFITKFVAKILPIINKIQPSFFEVTVALSLYYFYKKKVDLAIIEVGLGGRLDSTNIIKPIISVITNVSLDHMNLLGNNVKKIATEKAGIIKKETPVIIGREQKEIKNIFINKAKKEKSKLIFAKKYNIKITPKYQKENANTVISILKLMVEKGYKIDLQKIIKNINQEITVMGRWNIINKRPLTIIDSAHNTDGFMKINKEIKEIKHRKTHIVFGCSNDKKVKDNLKFFPKKGKYYFCQANVIRSKNYLTFKNIGDDLNINYTLIKSPLQALKKAQEQAKKDDLIIVTGSIFLVGEVLEKFCDI